MKIRTKLAGVVLAAGVVASGAAACSPAHADVYPPTSYGQYYGNHWHCYYVSDPAEAAALINAGHCHYGDVPTLMPLWWHERYYAYYSWPGYYNHYVPYRSRSTYVNVQVNTFGKTYHSAIQSQSRLATYRGRNGKTISGTRVKPKFSTKARSFGGGSSRSRSTTGGSSRTGQGSRSGSRSSCCTSRRSTGGGFGGGSGRSFGGGSSRRR